MKNKLFIAALAASITVPVMVAPVDTLASGKTFSDVSPKNPYYNIINTMADKGIISGYENGMFKPNETLSRKHAAALINRAVAIKPIRNVAVPKDLTKANPYYNDIMALLNAGLIQVDGKGNVNPNKALNRGEMAKILTVAYGLKGSKHPLKDVSKANEPYVAALYENNVTTGFEDGTFKEQQSLTRSHYAVFMYRAMEVKNGGNTNVPNPAPTPTPPKTITMNSTDKEIHDYIKSSNLFEKGIEMPNPIALKEFESFKKVLVNTENILEGTNLKVTYLSGSTIYLRQDNWKFVDRLLTSQVGFETDRAKGFQKISFDYTLPHSQEVAKRILNIVYGSDFDTKEIGAMIDKKIEEGLKDTNKVFRNIEILEMNGFKIRLGVDKDGEANHFWIDIRKQ
ncbi:S-layer homology domain-containing protein [Solibacillus sp. FSL W7-1436]|uniref:S-layer homology domain-containing protein n=1 Tax=Solibacillus sp. FSL W7-1436 TaxID=2921705 RepID=UPI0030F9C3D2